MRAIEDGAAIRLKFAVIPSEERSDDEESPSYGGDFSNVFDVGRNDRTLRIRPRNDSRSFLQTLTESVFVVRFGSQRFQRLDTVMDVCRGMGILAVEGFDKTLANGHTVFVIGLRQHNYQL